jgi:uncharacterized spore protein YtfJ
MTLHLGKYSRASDAEVQFGSVQQCILLNLELNFAFGSGGSLNPEPNLSNAFAAFGSGSVRGSHLNPIYYIATIKYLNI